jgi:hypothetical protein
MSIPAIPTTHGGIEYRSRLEARWAAFFDELHWQHTYEPFDGAGYIPDFLIRGDWPCLVEVKPAATKAQYEAPITKIETGLATAWAGDLLIVGADPLPLGNLGYRDREVDTSAHPTVGLIGEWWPDENDAPDWLWTEAHWCSCGTCGQPGIFSSLHRVMLCCGHYDINEPLTSLTAGTIGTLWAKACNAVKWRGAPPTDPWTDPRIAMDVPAPFSNVLRSLFNLTDRP